MDTNDSVSWDDLPLMPEHRQKLVDAAITPAIAARFKIRSARATAELPTWAQGRRWADDVGTAIVYPWTDPRGQVYEQVRPDRPLIYEDEEHKYLFPSGCGAVLNTIIPVNDETETVLIVEGTKQGFAAGSYAPPKTAVYAVGGCRNWSTEGLPSSDLMVVEGKKVAIALDADAATNLEVYAAGMKLAEVCDNEGATSISFVRLGAMGTNGLDDVLANRPEDGRASHLARLVAKAKAKPADTKPNAKKPSREITVPEPDADRPRLFMDQDRLIVINRLTQVLLDRWNAHKMFDHGGVLSILSHERRQGQTDVPVLMALDKKTMTDLVQETAQTVRQGQQGELVYCFPEAPALDAIFSRYRMFAPIDRIARVPFVRRDGSICQTPGYDETSLTYLAVDSTMQVIQVPDEPTGDDVAWAVKLIREEWLFDFFNNMPDEASRTNTVALALTPFIRGLVSVVPMAVVDGLQMGVGKNLLADVAVAIPATGDGVEPMNWDPQDDSENRKQITSAFKDGADVYIFDEAHRLHGASLARVITAATWKDRNLGHSQMLGFRNQVTWVSLGNNVEVAGDIVRRVYRIALRPEVPNPQDRPSSDFRIPNIRRWTVEHRVEIITAMLILVRSWFAAGQPTAKETSFGSFEEWERIVGGILHLAGFEDFLGNTASWRRESNYDQQHWVAHVHWLLATFGDQVFSTAQVREAMQQGEHARTAEAPPGLTDMTGPAKDYNRALGKAYGRMNGVFFDGVKLIKAETMMHRGVQGWRVYGPVEDGLVDSEPVGPDVPDAPEGVEGVEGGKKPSSHGRKSPSRTTDAHVRISLRGVGGDSSPSAPSAPSAQPENRDEPEANGLEGELLTHDEHALPGSDQPSLFETLTDPTTYERLRPEDHVLTATETGVPQGWVFFDLETADAQLVHSAGPDFTRIAAWQEGDQIVVREGTVEVAEKLLRAERVVGHNILGFDLVPFVRHHGLDIHQMAADGRIVDTQLTEVLLNPPPGGTKAEGVPALYSLDHLGGQKFNVGKSLDLKQLVKRHGGRVVPRNQVGISDFDKIPVDDADYVRYCAQDVDLTTRLARTQRMDPGSDRAAYVRREHRIGAIALQISMNGVLVDQDLLRQRIVEVNGRKAEMKAKLADEYGAVFKTKGGGDARTLTEPDKLAVERAFNDLGVSLPRSESGKMPATGKDVMKEIIDRYEANAEVVELARTVMTFNGARTVYQTAMDCLRPDGRVHSTINMYQATGRWSVTDPGMTVFGKRGGRYVEREIFIPEPGHVMISADLSQVDARAVAAWSQDENYMAMFDPARIAADGERIDLHKEVAFQMFGDRDRRDDAKAMSHGYNYGLGFTKLAAQHGEELARAFLNTMRDQFGRLVEWKDEIRRESSNNGFMLDNGWGRLMKVTPDRNHTQAPALVGQSAARDIMMEGLLRLPRWVLPMLRVQVHDEIVLSVPEDQATEIMAIVKDALSFPWRPFNGARGHEKPIQIEADCTPRLGTSWGDVYRKEG